MRGPVEPLTRELEGGRAVTNVVHQLVARAERRIEGVLAAGLWRPTLPAWRRAATRATLQVRLAGDGADTEGLTLPAAAANHPTMLLVDGVHSLIASGADDGLAGLWSSHPLIALLTRAALAGPG